MTSGGSDWAAQRMAEFLWQITSFPDQTTAELSAVERIGEAVEAEVVAIVRKDDVSTSIGFPRGKVPVPYLVGVAQGKVSAEEAVGSQECRYVTIALEDDTDASLVVGRYGDVGFSAPELNLLRGMARVLALGLRTLRLVEVERELREQSERQAQELERQSLELNERQRLFERLSKIQRSISHKADLEEVFNAITGSAGELLAEPDAIVGLRLLDPDDPEGLIMVSCSGVSDDLADDLRRSRLDQGAGGNAITDGTLVIIEDYSSADSAIPAFRSDVTAAMAAPVFDKDEVVGSLVFASRRPGRRFSESEQEILLAFAQHASLAVRDAREVQDLRTSFSESLTGISNRAAKEKHELVAQLHQAQKMEAVGRLAGGIAHDFNNVLMVIQTSAMLLKDSVDSDPESLEELNEIVEASDRAAQLVKQLLTFSRKQVLQTQSVDVNRRLAETAGMLRRAVGSHIEVDLVPAEGTPNVSIDPTHLEQILLNLAVNARDAMPTGGSLVIRCDSVSISEHPMVEPGPYLSLRVADSGPGIAAEDLEHIFEPFFTTKAQGKGTGLGLATVYGIVSGAGGNIEVESEPGRGTCFNILLPLADEPAPSTSDVSAAVPGDDGADERLRILVVDDEDSVREMVRRMLTREGHEATPASSGAEALALIASGMAEFDLILSDVVMPQMTGIQLLRELRSTGPTCPVVLMSAYADQGIAEPGMLDTASAFIAKPFDLRTLRGAIDEALCRNPA